MLQGLGGGQAEGGGIVAVGGVLGNLHRRGHGRVLGQKALCRGLLIGADGQVQHLVLGVLDHIHGDALLISFLLSCLSPAASGSGAGPGPAAYRPGEYIPGPAPSGKTPPPGSGRPRSGPGEAGPGSRAPGLRAGHSPPAPGSTEWPAWAPPSGGCGRTAPRRFPGRRRYRAGPTRRRSAAGYRRPKSAASRRRRQTGCGW